LNAFESGERKNIPAVLVYAHNRGRVLMIHRDAPGRQSTDYHAGKWNGLGGKCEPDESAWQSAAREFREESALTIEPTRFRALGTLQFPNFKAHKKEDWSVFVFVVDVEDAEAARVAQGSDEGSLHWIAESDLLELNLWPGDRRFLPHVLARTPFIGTIWYSGPEVTRYEIRKL